MKKSTFLIPLLLLVVAGLYAQVTIQVNCNSGTNLTGSVSSGGVKNDGNMVTINSGANRGWANYSIPTLPAGATITAVNAVFTTYSSVSSGATNPLYLFTGDPASMGGAALYTACGSGTTVNNTTWTANAVNTKLLTAAGIATVSGAQGSTINMGYVRGSTNTYNIYGYPQAGSLPRLDITYTAPACSGTPAGGTASATVTSGSCSVATTLTCSSLPVPGMTYQWQSSSDNVTFTDITGATAASYSTTITATTYFRRVETCTNSNLSANSSSVQITVNVLSAGTTTSSANPICSGVSFTLGLTGAPTSGVTYQWQNSPDNITYTNITGATAISYTTSQTAATWYHCVVTCTAAGTTATSTNLNETMKAAYLCGCTPTSTCSFEGISNVTLNTLNNTTGTTCGTGYNSYIGASGVSVPDLVAGTSVPISIATYSDASSLEYCKVWIDLNQDGDFVDAGELVANLGSFSNYTTHTFTGNVVIPAGASPGNAAMQVRLIYNSDPDPCTVYSFGETETYLVNILQPNSCTGTPNPGTAASPDSVCTGSNVALSLSGYTIDLGITFQWQESSNNTSWSNIAGATTTAYSAGPITAEMWYRCIVTCTNGGGSAISNVRHVTIASPPVAGTVAGPSPVPVGVVNTYTVTGSNGSIQWQFATAAAGPWANIVGATSASQTIVFNTAGTYYIRVEVSKPGCTSAQSNVLTIVATIANDNACSSTVIPVDGANHGPFYNSGATAQADEAHPTLANCTTGWCETAVQNSVWFSFVAPASRRVKIETFTLSGSTDNQIALYSAAACDSLVAPGNPGVVLLGANDDANSGGNAFTAALYDVTCLTAGQTYYIQMDGYFGSTGIYNIKITELAAPNTSFTGLSNVCLPGGSAVQTLTPTTTGGTFSGPGVTGNTFDPVAAGVGTHTITYTMLTCYSTSQTVIVVEEMPETCNGLDDDCDGTVDDGVQNSYWVDGDADGYGGGDTPVLACTAPTGYVLDHTDCNDANFNIHPGALEICANGIDENCDTYDGIADFSHTVTSSAPPNCAKATVTISGILGGTPPFMYSKNNGTSYQTSNVFPALAAGPYTFVVKDATGCTKTKAVTVTTFAVNTGFAQPSCYGGSNGTATAMPVNGTPTYSYLWSNGQTTAMATGLAKGTYTVTVTDQNTCTKTGKAVVSEPGLVKDKVNVTKILCNGVLSGAISQASGYPQGGVPPYSFQWAGIVSTSGSIMNLGPGTYTVTATDANGCTSTLSVITTVLTEPLALALSITKTNVLCHGASTGKAKAIVTGGTGAKTYLWSNLGTTQEITLLPADTYTVTATDANMCTISGSTTITEPATNVSIASYALAGPNNAGNYTVTVTGAGGVAPYKYRRTTNTAMPPMWGGQTAGALTNVPPGTWIFEAQDANKCTFQEMHTVGGVFAPPTTDDRNDATAQAFSLVPNPTRGSVSILFEGALPTSGNIEVRNAAGSLLRSIPVGSLGSGNRLSLENVAGGVLFVTYRSDSGATLTKRLVVIE